jgi:hypothetical protein
MIVPGFGPHGCVRIDTGKKQKMEKPDVGIIVGIKGIVSLKDLEELFPLGSKT